MSNAVYIAGVGITHPKNGSQSASSLNDTILSAGTKALLDAGVSYNDVKASVACFLDRNLNIERTSFEVFGRTGTPVYKVDNYSGLHVASQFVRSGAADCVMVIGFDQVRSSMLAMEDCPKRAQLTDAVRNRVTRDEYSATTA